MRKIISKICTKNILLLLTAAFLAVEIYAQKQSAEHLTFKGVPIDGTVNEFVAKMKQNGFKFVLKSSGVVYLEGDFANYRDCELAVTTPRDKDLVSQIEVSLPKRDTWSAVSSDYYTIKEALTEKYGPPAENVEKVESVEGTTDESRQNWSVRLSGGRYYASYITDKGNIQLSIEPTYYKIYVLLIYKDKINGDIMKGKAMEDL